MKEKKQAMNEKDLENVSGGMNIDTTSVQGGLNLNNITSDVKVDEKETPSITSTINENVISKGAVR